MGIVNGTNLDFMGDIRPNKAQWDFTLRAYVKGHPTQIQGTYQCDLGEFGGRIGMLDNIFDKSVFLGVR